MLEFFGLRKPSIEKLKAKRDVDGLIKELKYDEKYSGGDYERNAAAEALGQIGDERAVEPLIAALNEYRGPRIAAANALGQFRNERALKALIHTYYSESTNTNTFTKNPSLVSVAESALVQVSKKLGVEAIPLIIANYLELGARKALVLMGDDAVALLIPYLKNEDKHIRLRTARLLAEARDVRAVEPLLAVLMEDKERDVRRDVVDALGEIGDVRAVEPLLAVLIEDKEQPVNLGMRTLRECAVEALGKIGGVPVVESLVMALKDTRIRSQAAETLQKLNYEPSNELEGVMMAVATLQWEKVVSFGAIAIGTLEEAPECLKVGETLARIDHTRGIQWFLKVLKNRNWNYDGGEPISVISYVDSLYKIIEQTITSVTDEHLQELLSLSDIVYSYMDNSGERIELIEGCSVSCSQVNELARKELIRRGQRS